VTTRKLTDKQQRFVEQYLLDLNATRAAKDAGFSAKTANVKGAQLMANEGIQSAIQRAMTERSKRTEVTADAIVAQLAKIAFVDIKDIVEWDSSGVRVRDSAGVDGTVLTEVSETMSEGGWTKKVKLADRMRALELLGKHLGLFTDKLKVDIDVSLADVLTIAWERVNNGGH